MSRKTTGLILLTLLGGAATVPSGTEAAPASPGPAAATPACEAPTALGRIACGLSGQLPELDTALVVSLSVRGAVEGPSPLALGERLSWLVAGQSRLQDGGAVATAAEAQLRARHFDKLVLLTPEMAHAEFRVTADVIVTPRGFWARVKQPKPVPVHHAYASSRVDAELRSFQPKIPLVASQTSKAAAPLTHTEALACGDLDGDGALELILADRHRVLVGRIRAARLEPFAEANWKDLSEVSATPLRQPLTTLSLSETKHVDIGSTDRADWVRLSPTLKPESRLPNLLPWPGMGCSKRTGLGLSATPSACTQATASTGEATAGGELDTIAGALLSTPDGKSIKVWASRSLGEPTLQLFDDAGHRATLHDVGALAALGDLNLDGSAEIAVSRNTLDPMQDSLRVYSWAPPNEPSLQFELPVRGGVHAATLCPPDDAGMAPLVLATQAELWVVQ